MFSGRGQKCCVCTSSLVSQLPPLPHNLQQQQKQQNSLFSPQEPAGYILRVRSCRAPAQSLPVTSHTLGKVQTPPPLHPAPTPPVPSASTFFTCPTPSNSDPASGLTGACLLPEGPCTAVLLHRSSPHFLRSLFSRQLLRQPLPDCCESPRTPHTDTHSAPTC